MKKLGFKRPWTFVFLVFIVVLFIASQVPSIMGAKYNYNGSDDIWFGRFTHSEWIRSHNIFSTIGAGIYTAAYIWAQWQGNFTAVFMFAFNPSTFDPWGVSMFFVPFVILIPLGFGTFFVCQSVLGKYLKINWEVYTGFAFFLLTVFTQLVPTYRETFYWWAASVNYPFYLGILLLCITCILRYFTASKNLTKKLYFAGATILALFISGGMYVYFTLTLSLFIFAIIFKEAIFKNSRCRELYFIMIPYIIFWGINIFSPGNPWRMQSTEKDAIRNPILAVFKSLEYGFGTIFSTYPTTGTQGYPYFQNGINFAYLCMFVVGLIFCFVFVKNVKFKFPKPWLFVLGLFLTYCSWYTPFIYASGMIVMPRLFNTGYFINWFFQMLGMSYIMGALKPYLIKFYKKRRFSISEAILGNAKGLVQLVAIPVLFAVAINCYFGMNNYANNFKAIHPGALGAIQGMTELTCQFGNDGSADSKDPSKPCSSGTQSTRDNKGTNIRKTQAEWNEQYINQFKYDLLAGSGTITDAEADACINDFYGATISGQTCADKIKNSKTANLPDTPEEDKLLTAHLDMCPQAGNGYNKFAQVFWNINNQYDYKYTAPEGDYKAGDIKNNRSVTAHYPNFAKPLPTTKSKYGPFEDIPYYKLQKQEDCQSQGMLDLHA